MGLERPNCGQQPERKDYNQTGESQMTLSRFVALLVVACGVTGWSQEHTLSTIAGQASGQTYAISTFAGGLLPANSPATQTSIGVVNGVAVDSSGNVFLTSVELAAVLRLDVKTGLWSAVAGNGTRGFSGDNGRAVNAQLSAPVGVAVDSAGNLYIADGGDNRIRKVSNGIITTVAVIGTSGTLSSDAGPAKVYSPPGIAVDSAGNLYISDSIHTGPLLWFGGLSDRPVANRGRPMESK